MIEAICFFVGCFVGAALVVAGFLVKAVQIENAVREYKLGYQPVNRGRGSPPPKEE